MKTLLKNACIYTPQGVIRDGFVAVDGTMIAAVGAARPEGDFDREKDMSGKLLLPGLVNAHTHAAMTLLRGVGTDLPLQKWLFDSVFPVEARLTGEDIRIGTALALLEMLPCGTTSFTDMYFFCDETAKAVIEMQKIRQNAYKKTKIFFIKNSSRIAKIYVTEFSPYGRKIIQKPKLVRISYLG